jgi:anti-sigma factor RsiW
VTCPDVALTGFVDDELDVEARQSVERHLATCEDCRALVADLRTIRAAAFTLDRREPPRELVGSVRRRVLAEPPPARVLAWPSLGRPQLAWLAAAAALIVATVVGVWPLLTTPATTDPAARAGASSASTEATVDSIEADLAAAEAHYERAIQGLEQIAKQDSRELDPQVASVLQKNLQVIDRAIGESRVALRSQPSSAHAQDSLFEAMRNKVALLQQTVELINEVRKGNPAEAGRLMQEMNR